MRLLLLEPLHHYSSRQNRNLCSKSISTDKTKICENTKEQLTPQLTPESPESGEIDTQNLPEDLAEIVQLWPELPEHIKQAVNALIGVFTSTKKQE